MKKKLFPFLVFSSVVLLDYITKKLIEIYVKPHEVNNVFPFLRIVNIKNTGAAFGLFANLGNNIFIIISLIAIILII
ncbi:MAG: signal peptidase II, partial [Nitrospirota bacterium]